MIIVFWGLIAAVCYAYFGYPLFLALLDKLKKRRPVKTGDITPYVSIVIPAYNEEAAVDMKVENLLSLDYPREKFEVVFVSDCSTDKTEEAVRRHQGKGIKLHCMGKRGGKIAGYKSVVPSLKGEIIVFTDATSMLTYQSVRAMAGNFADSTVGCVGGLLQYTDPEKADIARGELSYWDYEVLIKLRESRISSLTSVSGTLYAVRKELFPLNMPDDLADDLLVPLNAVRHKKRVVLETDAVCQEYAIHADGAEIRKRVRITVQNLAGLAHEADMLNIFKYGWFSVMLVSHKLLRILAAVCLPLIFFMNIFMIGSSMLYNLLLIGQVAFYGSGLISCNMEHKRPKILNILFYFCLTNLAILLGIVKFLKGQKMTTWETAR